VEPNDASAFTAAMHRHDRENRADIIKLAKGAVLGMICGAIGVIIVVIALIA